LKTGFAIRELVVMGPDKPNAAVSFEMGLNVIVGPSDTGKTYIFQCLDFALGAGSPPKAIPEADGYETVQVSISTSDERSFTLTRSLRGGDIRLSTEDAVDVVLEAKHSTEDPENISTFLLEASGLTGKTVRTNASGKTRSLSFRDVAHLAFVDEETVMTDRSPAQTGQWTTRTAESRVLRLLLTGEDDSSVVARERPAIKQARQAERSELLKALIATLRDSYQGVTRPESLDAAIGELANRKAVAEEASQALTTIQGAAGGVEERRRRTWSELRSFQSRADVLLELQTRFELLKRQYETDLDRLASIAEVGLRIDQTPAKRCPVCGAPAEHQEHEHAVERESPAEVRASCEAERVKIATLMADLQATVASNAAELAEATAGAEERGAELTSLDQELADSLRPRVAAATAAFRGAERLVRDGERTLQLIRYEDELRSRLAVAEKPVRRVERLPSPKVSSGEAEGFARKAETLLEAWHFPEGGRVTFSEQDQDLVIGARHRASYGKGVLALTHAAFSLALLRFCIDSDLPSPGMVAIDSPLVVYREPDPEEGAFPRGVKDLFYRSIARSFGDAQVFIFENEVPPADLGEEANVISFTKTGSGRYGFIPQIGHSGSGEPT
jgi:hypothetical protein